MWKLVAGGAAILLGGAYIVCKVLEEENERKAEELSHKTDKYTQELNAQREELERINSMNNKVEQLQQKQQLFIAFRQKSQEAYQVYLDVREHVKMLKQQLRAAIVAKNKAKKELNAIKSGTLFDKIKHILGRATPIEDSPKFQEKLQQIRDYNVFCQNLMKMIDEQKLLQKNYHSKLQSINRQTRSINLERKQLRDEHSKPLSCSDCGKMFSLKVGELFFFKQKRLQYPKRCPECRAIKKRNVKKLAR